MASDTPLPIFVNRAAELASFDRIIAGQTTGLRQHVAVLGLRRIGKSLLLDEVQRRHPHLAIARLDVDAVVATPDDFARAVVAETLSGVLRARGNRHFVGETDDALRAAVELLVPTVVPALDDLLAALAASAYGRLLNGVFRFPGLVSEELGLPILLMLDEFQDLTRLSAFPGTESLLGSLRAALDRPGQVAFVAAGSRVTAMRRLLEEGGSPLFARFTVIDLRPFTLDASRELAAAIWADETHFDPDAAVRVHRLSGGWPYCVHALAQRAVQIAGDDRVTPNVVDVALQHEIIGRDGAIAFHCQYLLRTALEGSDTVEENRREAILRAVARDQPFPRARLARRLTRHYSRAEIYRTINWLIDTDFLIETDGMLHLADPIFAVWLNVEPDRRDPLSALGQPEALRRLLAWFVEQHAADRTELGYLFERSVENLVRQFRGQTVLGRFFGVAGDVTLPLVRDVAPERLDDPEARYGDAPDSYELDLVTTADDGGDVWAVECKHRAGAMTRSMLERFVQSARAIERARQITFRGLWAVAPNGFRSDAVEFAEPHRIYRSGRRQLEGLERAIRNLHAPT